MSHDGSSRADWWRTHMHAISVCENLPGASATSCSGACREMAEQAMALADAEFRWAAADIEEDTQGPLKGYQEAHDSRLSRLSRNVGLIDAADILRHWKDTHA